MSKLLVLFLEPEDVLLRLLTVVSMPGLCLLEPNL